MPYLLMLLAALLVACSPAVVPTATLPTYKPAPLKPPLEEEKKDILPEKEGAPTALKACDSCKVPFGGVLIDAHLAAKYKLITADRDRLRRLIEIDRRAWSRSHAVTQQAFNSMAQRVYRSWWEKYKGTLGFWAGTAVGMGLAVLSVYGVSRVQK